MSSPPRSFEAVAREVRRWLQLDQYNRAKYFTSQDWYANLMFRSQARFVLFPTRFSAEPDQALYSPAVARFIWEVVCDNPIRSASADGDAVTLAPGSRDIAVSNRTTRLTQQSVRPLLIRDFAEFVEQHSLTTDPASVHQAMANYRSEDLEDEHAATLLTAVDEFPAPYADSDAHLTVDLRASDKQILADFERWLNQARDIYRLADGARRKRNVTETLQGKWVQRRILAYLDVRLWASLHDVPVGLLDWQSLIFSDLRNPPTFDDERLFECACQAISPEIVEMLYLDALG